MERALPKLLEKVLASGARAVVRVGDEQGMDRLNKALWDYEERSFLPHGSAKEPHGEQQPGYITYAEENPNGAEILVITDGSSVPAEPGFTKVLDMFNGQDEAALTHARSRWKSYKDEGRELKYIQQQENGGWKEVA